MRDFSVLLSLNWQKFRFPLCYYWLSGQQFYLFKLERTTQWQGLEYLLERMESWTLCTDVHGLTATAHMALEPGVQSIYISGSDGHWCAAEWKETEHPTLGSQLLKGTLRSQLCRRRPGVKMPICVCSTFAGSGPFIGSLTGEMSESSTATTSAGLSIPGPSPRYWPTEAFLQWLGLSVCVNHLSMICPCAFPPQVNTFGVGELVRVLEDIESVKRLQAGHGEWTDSMAPVCSFSLILFNTNLSWYFSFT